MDVEVGEEGTEVGVRFIHRVFSNRDNLHSVR